MNHLPLNALALLLAIAGPIGAETATPTETPAPPAPEPVPVLMRTSMGDVTLALWPSAAPKTVANFIGLAEGTKAFKDPRSGQMVQRPFYDGLTFHRVIDDFMIQGGCPQGTGTGGPGFTFADEIDAEALGLDDELVIQDEDALLRLLTAGRGALTPQQHQQLVQSSFHQSCAYQFIDFMKLVVNPEYQEADLGRLTDPVAVRDAMRKVINACATVSLQDFYEKLGYEYTEGLASRMPLDGYLCMANSGPNTNGSQFFINLTDNKYLAGKHTVFGEVVGGMEVIRAIGKVQVQQGNNKPLQEVVILSIRRLQDEDGSPDTPAADSGPAAGDEP